MGGILYVVAGGTVLLASVVSFVLARRYGAGLALLLPVLALAAFLGMEWQARSPGEGMDLGASLVFAAPVLLGVLAGVAAARLFRS